MKPPVNTNITGLRPSATLAINEKSQALIDQGKQVETHCSKNPTKNRILILNYPSNPTGSTLNKKQLKELASVARKYKVLILSDEIYSDVHHKGKHRSIAQYYSEGTIVSSGLSKWCGAGGWRIGTFVFPKELRWLLDQMAVVASETFTTTSAPIQYAAVRAYQGGKDIETYLINSRKVLKTIAQRVHELLIGYHISNPKPKGGFYLMPNFSYYTKSLARKGINTSTELCSRLLAETGVALLPLEAFGYAPEVLGARLSYVDFDGAKALELVAANTIVSAEQLAPKVIEGIHKMGQWVK